VLKEQKAQQFDDLKELEQQRNIMTEKAHQLAEQYEDVAELQRLLIKRWVVRISLFLLFL
jgi:nuclear pore complex protein Nup88